MKTHQDLRITLSQLGALYGVRGLLANKQVTMHRVTDDKATTLSAAQACVGSKHLFHMSQIFDENQHCGSIGCIGGYMGNILGDGSLVCHQEPGDAFYELFYPYGVKDWNKITPQHAIKAIDNFLATGKPIWNKVVPKSNWDDYYARNRMVA